MSKGWGWWLPKRQSEEEEPEKKSRSRIDELIETLKNIRSSIDEAIRYLEERDMTLAYEYVDEAYEKIIDVHREMRRPIRF